jgi:probable rRNA maturation factor
VPASLIRFHSEITGFKPLSPLIRRRWIEQVIRAEKKSPGNLNFIFCSDPYLLDINVRYLNHDYYTDVITFDYSSGKTVAGDIFISIDRVKDNALTEKQDFETELSRILIHGVLHLLGYSDKGSIPKAQMRKKEDKYLSLLGKK